MSFKMRPEVEEWFLRVVHTKGSAAPKFDAYYLCLMMGFATGRAEEPANVSEFVDYFVSDYRPAQNTIIGMLIAAEARLQGVDLGNRLAIRTLLLNYVSPVAPVGLTAAGFERLNWYANGGFNEIVARYPDGRPWSAADFFQWYLPTVQGAVKGNTWWTAHAPL